ncbi:MAG: right-handed parallel beta-helix repeat-containing protein [Candidatus Eisenbacteria bacterium]|nr:right-handed parallel beta-helix repeat-containing protein [Candidatus Eisenbacteria bacterium]
MKRCAVMLFCLAFSIPALCAAGVWLVLPDGSGDFPTIQAAIDASSDGDVVMLADGTFQGEGNRDLDLLGKGIAVRSQSGVADVCVIDCYGTEGHWGFRFVSGESPSCSIERLTIRGGGAWGDLTDGAGALCRGSSPTFLGCTFASNSADSAGGAIACFEGSAPRIVDCRFQTNSAIYYGGGAIVSREGSSPQIENCSFLHSWALWSGGAVLFDGPSEGSVIDCTFIGNATKMAGEGGAILCRNGADVRIERCVFESNSAGGPGSAISALQSNPEIRECTFYRNEPAPMRCLASAAHLWRCTFYQNFDMECSGLHCEQGAAPVVENTIFAAGRVGPAVFCADGASDPLFRCCDIFGNEGGDWVGCAEDQLGVNGNISLDPLFCDPENFDLTLDAQSPCAPFTPPNEECDQIGAWPVGCGSTATESVSWGRVRALFHP